MQGRGAVWLVLHGHLDQSIRHAQGTEQGGDLIGQALPGLRSGGAQRARGRLEGIAGVSLLFQQRRTPRIAVFQGVQLLAQGAHQGVKRIGLHMVLARQLVQFGQALFDLRQALGIQLQGIQLPLRIGRRLLRLNACTVDQLGNAGVARIQPLQAGRQLGRRVECTRHRLLAVPVQQLAQALGVLDQPVGIGQLAVLGIELLDLGVLRRDALEFIELEAQELDLLAGVSPRITQGLQGVAGGLPLLDRLANSCQRRFVVAQAVQQCASGGGPQQPLAVVLAMDVQQQPAEGAQLGHGGG